MNLQDAVSSPVNGLLEISIVEDDVRALAAELEGDTLQVSLSRTLHDLAADANVDLKAHWVESQLEVLVNGDAADRRKHNPVSKKEELALLMHR